jgi:hypothetical protein
MQSTAACTDPPIDAARVVARHIGAHFFELQAAAALHAAMRAHQACARRMRAAQPGAAG